MFLVVFYQLWYLFDQLILSQRLRLLQRRIILCLVHIDLLGLLTSSRRFVQGRLWCLVATNIGSRAKIRSLRSLLCLGIGTSIVRVSTHGPREEILLLHLMLHILLLLSSYRALIGGCPLDVARVSSHARCVHRRGWDPTRLLANLRLSHGWWIVLLLWDGPLRATSIVTLLRRWWNFEALNEFLVVLTSCTFPISYAFNSMLYIMSFS